jgi:flagellar protein FliS
MNQANVYSAYKNNEVMTASPTKLIIMLYDGAIKNLKLAEFAIRESKIEKTNEHLKKAQDIIAEFMSTLNFEQGGDIAINLQQLYEYMFNKLIRANIDKDVVAVTEVRGYLEELRETWLKI